jgi:sulfur carrier protein ThiS adenylyltransferase
LKKHIFKVKDASVGIMGRGGLGVLLAVALAGFGDNNKICTRKIRKRVYLVGDGATGAKPGQGLMALLVGIAAHHQANQIWRLLLEVACE